RICSEIFRVLRPGSQFVIVTTNPGAFGHSFKTFRYDTLKTSASGERVKCTVFTADKELELLDTYWTIADYRSSLEISGFEVASIFFPFVSRRQFPDTDEPAVAPSVVIEAVKPSEV